MPLFFILSGLVKSEDGIYWNKLKKYFYAYCIPYIIMMIVSDGISARKLIHYLFFRQSVLLSYSPLASWFLPCLVLSNILVDLKCQIINITIKNKKLLRMVMEIACIVLFLFLAKLLDSTRINDALWYYNIAFIGAAYIDSGQFLISMWKEIGLGAKWNLLGRGKVISLGIVLFLVGSSIAYFNETVYFVIAKYGNFLLMFFASMLLVGAICCFSYAINNHFLQYVGRITVFIMSYHHLALNFWVIGIACVNLDTYIGIDNIIMQGGLAVLAMVVFLKLIPIPMYKAKES